MEQDTHVFQGLKRDIHPLRQDSKFLWDARNIRITNHEDNTLLSVTNEKGTDKLLSFDTGDLYVGHCVLGSFLVVFIYNSINKASKIYRLEYIDNSIVICTLFNSKNIRDYDGWSPEFPIETLGIHETELIQKVYWVDGKHQPRLINITQPELNSSKKEVYTRLTSEDSVDFTEEYKFNNYSFNFVSDLKLKETVNIIKGEGGSFDSGVIQYAFTYYNKYYQETNIFYVTPLQYISFNNRGGSPEENTTNSFKITIDNIDSNFKFLRIYSIHRTSLDSQPTVKLVTDIDLSNSTSVHYTDTGTNGSIVDPTFLLYVGGESIIANTLEAKDNTLFLGNIEYTKTSVPEEIKEDIRNSCKEKVVSVIKSTVLKDAREENSYYDYTSQLSLGNTSGFKVGETYRVGLQFQYKNGKWSEPIYIKDVVAGIDSLKKTIHPNISHKKVQNLTTVELNTVALNINSSNLPRVQDLIDKGYVKVRGIIVYPSIYDRDIIAQGIICPTVFSIKDRVSNNPFSQSSWFFRPIGKDLENNTEVDQGATIEYKHLSHLLGPENRGGEIQNMQSIDFTAANSNVIRGDSNYNTFFVDQSIVTFHSPEIEFNNSIIETLDNNKFKVDIVGLTRFKSNYGDIKINMSTPPIQWSDEGFYHKAVSSDNYSNRALISGLFYKGHSVKQKDDKVVYNDAQGASRAWMIYPWHRSGSLNNDVSRTTLGGTRSAVLERKVISNLRYSDNNIWLDEKKEYTEDEISPISIFRSNEVSLTKLPSFTSDSSSINYYGNIDSLITYNKKSSNDGGYQYYVNKDKFDTGFNADISVLGVDFDAKTDRDFLYSREPVRMKYKSGPHAVFSFNYKPQGSSESQSSILPYITDGEKSLNEYKGHIYPFWINKKAENNITEATDVVMDIFIDLPSDEPQVDEKCKKELANEDQGYIAGSLALANNTFRPSDNTVRSLYEKSLGGEWIYKGIDEKEEGNYYKYIDSKGNSTYYKVVHIGNGVGLQKEDLSDDDFIKFQVSQKSITVNSIDEVAPFLYLAEIKRKDRISDENRFGGNTPEARKNNLWLPAGEPILLEDIINVQQGKYPNIMYTYGDTWYQRYDCLKTYPFTQEDENSVVEIGSFLCETHLNIDGRYDKNRGQSSNIYVNPTNFNLFNEVYSQSNNFFNSRELPEDFYKTNRYINQVLWSKNKTFGEEVDTWTNITLANTLDMNGEGGNITAIRTFNDTLLCFQEKALSKINFNNRVQIPTSDGVPIEISNNAKVDGYLTLSNIIGCYNKWSIVNSPIGIYFIDANTKSLYLYNGQLSDLSTDRGMSWWVREINPYIKWSPVTSDNNGVRTFFDNSKGDIYFVPGPSDNQQDALCYSEKLQQFTSFMSYGGSEAMINFNNNFNIIKAINNTSKIYIMNKGLYNRFFDEETSRPYSISFVSNESPTVTKVFDTIEMRADILDNGNLTAYNNKIPFNYIYTYNEYQQGEDELINNKNIKKKFRIWRCNIPRDNKVADGLYGTESDKITKFGKARMRNPWVNITLSNNNENDTSRFILHDLTVNYSL